MRTAWTWWLAVSGAAVLGTAIAGTVITGDSLLGTLDPASQFEFRLHTRWGRTLEGRFPLVEGEVVALVDGRRQVRFRIDARAIEIVDYPRYTEITRSPRFFDVARYPLIEFVSDPYSAQLPHAGGALDGELRMHGVRRRERFLLEPSTCQRPGYDCDIVAVGSVRRSDYDLDRWTLALREQVRFALRVRWRAPASAPAGEASP